MEYSMRKAIKNWRYVASLSLIVSTCVYATWNLSANAQTDTPCLLSVKAVSNWLKSSEAIGARKLLSGPGSSPPRCKSKCDGCRPCNPVRVSVPPGTPVTAEYYPEAWRCKCRNKLYMP